MGVPVKKRVLLFVDRYIESNGFSPTLVEIAVGIGISSKSISLISRTLKDLTAEGLLKQKSKGYRNIQLLPSENVGELPTLGNEQKKFKLNDMLSSNTDFVWQVPNGDMNTIGIKEKDMIICRRSEQVSEGDIVLAEVVDLGSLLCQISFQIPNRLTLVSGTGKPRAYLPSRVEIKGRVVGLLRL